MEAERTYTEAELQERLKQARDMARAMAWRDIFVLFRDANRQHFANLMAHGYFVVAVELQHPDGRHNRTPDHPLYDGCTTHPEFGKGACGVKADRVACPDHRALGPLPTCKACREQAQPNSACRFNGYSTQTCALGTLGCVIDHARTRGVPVGGINNHSEIPKGIKNADGVDSHGEVPRG